MPSGRARLAASSSLLGDKEKPEVTRHLNDTSVTDICELGGDFATMRDVHYEVKCWNSSGGATPPSLFTECVSGLECV